MRATTKEIVFSVLFISEVARISNALFIPAVES
ncbi:hypothetical protein B0G77_3704 [Paraburkholderia sp. BL10I2N1]|nr:hypothetical protein B0G77_3704 [Paraburkholderia sp. BL10I2N1]